MDISLSSCNFYAICMIVVTFFSSLVADRTSLKIYEDIQGDIFCFRRLNATHQIGCASDRSGNIGIIHVIKDYMHLENVTSHPLYIPYIVAIPIELFNTDNMMLLKRAKDVQGVMILFDEDMNSTEKKTPEYFSPDQSCPNRNFGFYTDYPKYAYCKVHEWNKHEENRAIGMMYEDWGMPVFMITNSRSVQLIRQCYEKFNEPKDDVARPYPLCAAQLNSVMLAAKDSYTCMKRNRMVANLNQVKTCDPLSGKNIITTLFPTNKSEEVLDKSIIVVGCRLDTFSMFDRLAPGAHSTVTGLVTLLAVAKIMASLRNEIDFKMLQRRNILFTIFNGEAFDYIGSTRIVFDMERNEFPFPLINDIEEQPALINLNHISHFVEFSQLAPDDSTFWVHTDPISSANETVSKEVKRLFGLLQKATNKSKEITVKKINDFPPSPLPPASFQSFLRRKKDIPGIVIADHSEKFKNRYYNSMFDTNNTINATALSQTLFELSVATSKMLYEILTHEELKSSLPFNASLVSGILECYLTNASCDLFHQIADPSMTERLRVEPSPMYISVNLGGSKANPVTLYTRYLLAYLTGTPLENRNRKNCIGNANSQIYHYDWMTGANTSLAGVCVKSTVIYTVAESPAYVLDDWKSIVYSTWTESVWLETSVRIFLRPSRSQEIATLLTGIIIFILSIAVVYFINQRSSIIFNTKPLVSC